MAVPEHVENDSGSVAGMIEKLKGNKTIRFRCIFCGQEFDTVEECNVCEASH